MYYDRLFTWLSYLSLFVSLKYISSSNHCVIFDRYIYVLHIIFSETWNHNPGIKRPARGSYEGFIFVKFSNFFKQKQWTRHGSPQSHCWESTENVTVMEFNHRWRCTFMITYSFWELTLEVVHGEAESLNLKKSLNPRTSCSEFCWTKQYSRSLRADDKDTEIMKNFTYVHW